MNQDFPVGAMPVSVYMTTNGDAAMTDVPTKLWSRPVTPTPLPPLSPVQSSPLIWGDGRALHNLLKITFILRVCQCIHVIYVYMIHMWRSKDLGESVFSFHRRGPGG